MLTKDGLGADLPDSELSFTGPPIQVTFDGFLFDMDGTIIDSTGVVEKHWTHVGEEIGVDPEVILLSAHGRRSIDILKIVCPEKANWEYVCEMEARMPRLYAGDVQEIPGSRALLAALEKHHVPWLIVTSGTKQLVAGWLKALGLPMPAYFVSAESVAVGKPDPTCYQMGLRSLARNDGPGDPKACAGQPVDHPVRPTDADSVLVLEDAPAGIRAGKAAGCKVLGLLTSHTAREVIDAGPDWIVRDLTAVRVMNVERKSNNVVRTTLEISNTLIVPAKA
ncbi:glycerol-3-phosphate phosphatase [Niveomyces insectorum RCEF 264]|uniref:Glycerol-3-phosphate phosphatase n=1 Tax=Niveomyces insectorum RCEF 264 TaxID=1081102 RepID=A0A167U6D4_9HYPO|nr:glycerol-3-phosphate phosphatase [Niveomyces insectorum RCEF 264]